MNRSYSRTSHRPEKRKCDSDAATQCLLWAEEEILLSISSRAPLWEVLNGICTALDCQIGNVVSFVSLPADDAEELATIARNAALFGLFVFSSEGIVAENGELLGSLEMYCCASRCPSASESELIERAMCLAVMAIQRDIDVSRHSHLRDPEEPRSWGKLPLGLVYVH
jgi:hypothetical protein